MDSLFLLVVVLTLASCFGYYRRQSSGLVINKYKYGSEPLSLEFNLFFGETATIILFSSAFCSKCRIVKSKFDSYVEFFPEMSFVEIDVEANLQLVRNRKIFSTPTTVVLNRDRFEIARVLGIPKPYQLEKLLKSLSS